MTKPRFMPPCAAWPVHTSVARPGAQVVQIAGGAVASTERDDRVPLSDDEPLEPFAQPDQPTDEVADE
jgi:hypothetical protein